MKPSKQTIADVAMIARNAIDRIGELESRSIRLMRVHDEALRLASELDPLGGVESEAANELRRLHQCLRNVYEVWAGSEGIPAPTVASEAYLLSLVEQMRDAAKEGLK